MAQDYYSLLGISRDASTDEVKKAYRKMAHKYHPDKNPGDEEAEKKFKEANEAYQVLSDPQKRAQYDRFGATSGGGMSSSQSGGFDFGDMGGFSNMGGMGNMGGFEFNFGADSPFDDLEDVFNAFFGGGASKRSARGRRGATSRRKGVDIERPVELTLEDAAQGVKKTVSLKHKVTCDRCDGKGHESGSKVNNCPTCSGSGRVYQRSTTMFGIVQEEHLCPTCNGMGQVFEKPCKKCKGQSRVEETEKIEVNIPSGVNTGDRVRVSGKGEAGYHGSAPGDLFLVIELKSHKNLTKDGLDVYSHVPINYFDLLLGTTLDVYTVWGEVSMKVPALTDPKKHLRLKGYGFPRLNNASQTGDHYLILDVQMPKKLGKKEKEQLEELKGKLY
jgi:molecular chaperone DnaJ